MKQEHMNVLASCDGDSIYDCFYKYEGARFDTYDLRQKMYGGVKKWK